ncbi:unnamed protein product, partial [Rotaria sp. Silwood1]
MFDIDGVYNTQNDRIWAVNRAEANEKGGILQKKSFSQKVMVWLGVCSKGVSPLMIFDEGTVGHARYIKEVLPVALKYGNYVFGNDWTFQHDGAKPHIHQLTQQWCHDNFSGFIDEDHWPPNSPDLNPLDYCIWDEFVKMHAYFVPYGVSVLSQKEICSIERRVKNSMRSSLYEQQGITVVSTKKSTTFNKFLDSIDDDSTYSQQSACRSSTSTYATETKQYRRLASSYISGVGEDKNALSFWELNKHQPPYLTILARSYLATPATSVPSESAFSKSAYYR